jgi:tryptophan 2,3-dioxygenase
LATAAGRDGSTSAVASPPPARWSDYLPDPEGRRRLEFLTVLPQTDHHEEVTFLRTVHLTETCLWGILTRVMSAVELLKAARWAQAAGCLARATQLAQVQSSVFEIMKTMSPADFLAFRASTGDSSAVQSTTNHLVQIFMQGVDPAKTEALGQVPENQYLLRYANPHFVPLAAVLASVPTDDPDGSAARDEAHRLDREMYRWRASHYGVARRYLPPEASGTGGTAGAAYLKSFVHHRLSGAPGTDDEAIRLELWTDPEPPIRRVRARPVLSWEN